MRCVHVVNHFPLAQAPFILPRTNPNMSVLTVKLESLNQTVGGWTKLLANLTKVRLELFVRMMREANDNFARWVWRASEGDPKQCCQRHPEDGSRQNEKRTGGQTISSTTSSNSARFSLDMYHTYLHRDLL